MLALGSRPRPMRCMTHTLRALWCSTGGRLGCGLLGAAARVARLVVGALASLKQPPDVTACPHALQLLRREQWAEGNGKDGNGRLVSPVVIDPYIAKHLRAHQVLVVGWGCAEGCTHLLRCSWADHHSSLSPDIPVPSLFSLST